MPNTVRLADLDLDRYGALIVDIHNWRIEHLTPAARGTFVVPPANLLEHIEEVNVNVVTCGDQATIPMVYAVSRVVPVEYAEIVGTVSSASAGPGDTREHRRVHPHHLT